MRTKLLLLLSVFVLGLAGCQRNDVVTPNESKAPQAVTDPVQIQAIIDGDAPVGTMSEPRPSWLIIKGSGSNPPYFASLFPGGNTSGAALMSAGPFSECAFNVTELNGVEIMVEIKNAIGAVAQSAPFTVNTAVEICYVLFSDGENGLHVLTPVYPSAK